MRSRFFVLIVFSIVLSLFSHFPVLAAPRLRADAAISGSGQHGEPARPLPRPLQVQVVDSETGAPLPGFRIEFSAVSAPPEARELSFPASTVVTDGQGTARSEVQLGDKGGGYVASARLLDANGHVVDIAYFQLNARAPHWLLTLSMQLCAGLALFMFGLSQLSDGMRKSAGRALRSAMQLIARNRIVALALGALVTVVLQSSTATTVLLVGFVQAGLLSFAQTLGVILGADIGTTMTVQLISVKVTDFALIPVTIGFALLAMSRKESWRQAGEALMGAGLIFYGMAMMADSIAPLKHHEPFLSIIPRFSHPAAALFIGAIFTAILHSSAAFIGIVIVFAAQKLLSVETGIALCLGANVGTCFTAILASLNASVEARRVAAGHTLFKLLGVLLIAPWISTFGRMVAAFSGSTPSVERVIANAHTVFNIGIAFAFLPFLGPFARLVQMVIPDRRERLGNRVLLDDSLVTTPALALPAAKVEVLRLGRKAQGMVESILKPAFEKARLSREEVLQNESEVDDAYDAINLYLKKIIVHESSPEFLEEAFQMMRTANDLEQIADVVEDRLLPSVAKMEELGVRFSEEGCAELREYHTKTLKQISRALDVFDTVNLERAQHVSDRFEKYRLLAAELQETHFARLKSRIRAAEETSEIHLEILASLLEISDLATNIARNMLQGATVDGKPTLHRIVRSV